MKLEYPDLDKDAIIEIIRDLRRKLRATEEFFRAHFGQLPPLPGEGLLDETAGRFAHTSVRVACMTLLKEHGPTSVAVLHAELLNEGKKVPRRTVTSVLFRYKEFERVKGQLNVFKLRETVKTDSINE